MGRERITRRQKSISRLLTEKKKSHKNRLKNPKKKQYK